MLLDADDGHNTNEIIGFGQCRRGYEVLFYLFVLLFYSAVFKRCPVTSGDLLLPSGDQKILVLAPNVYAVHPGFQGFRDLGTQLLFLEPSLVLSSVSGTQSKSPFVKYKNE